MLFFLIFTFNCSAVRATALGCCPPIASEVIHIQLLRSYSICRLHYPPISSRVIHVQSLRDFVSLSISSQNPLHYIPSHIRQPIPSAQMLIRQFFMIKPH